MNCYSDKKNFLNNILDRKSERIYGLILKGGVRRRAWEIGDFATSDKPLKEFLPYIIETYQTCLEYIDLPGNDGIPMIDLNYGTHIFPAALGAKIFYHEKSSPCGMPFITSPADADNFKEPELENCRPLVRIIEMAKLIQQEFGKEIIIGPPDLQTGFDIACVAWDKTDLLCSMYETPETVKNFADICSNLLIKFLKELKYECPNSSLNGYIWSPFGVHVSNDECGIINNEMFEEFCLPELTNLSEEFGGLSMHCCANAQHQFNSFKKIPKFYAFNRVPTGVGWEKDNALEVLGGPEGPVMLITDSNLESIETILRKAPQNTRFIFYHLNLSSINTAKQWIEDVQKLISDKIKQ